jgi:hypothetical protein
MTECKLCGAVGGGNITCPLCRSSSLISEECKEALRGCVVGCPLGTEAGSEKHQNIRSINRHNRKLKRQGMQPL